MDMEHDTTDRVFLEYLQDTFILHFVFQICSVTMCLLLFQIGVCGFYKHNSDVSVSHVHITSRAKFLVKLHEPFLE